MSELDPRFETPVKKKIETPWRQYAKFNKYDESYPKIVYDGLSNGKTPAQIARILECSKSTLMRWIEEIEDMQEAYELGMTNFEADMEEKIQESLIQTDPDEALPAVNNKLIDMYLKSNLKKFADLDKKHDVIVNNINNVDGEDSQVLSKVADIMKSVARISDAPMKKQRLMDSLDIKDVTPVEIDNLEIEG